MTSLGPTTVRPPAKLACVVLAHTDPVQVKRLIAALDPLPVFVHCDSGAEPAVADEMLSGLPQRCVILDRRATGWARWENVEAEIAGYRAALELTDVTHIALMTGTDYPLVPTTVILSFLQDNYDRSMVWMHPLPYDAWGRTGGMNRIRFRHWAVGKRMLRLPFARRVPTDVQPAGGSQLKILCRAHARAVVDAYDNFPHLAAFWRRTWIPDETFVATILNTPAFVPHWRTETVPSNMWWIHWDETPQKSPPWLGYTQRAAVLSGRVYAEQELPSLFARKFSTAHSTTLLDAIDERRHHRSAPPVTPPSVPHD